MKAACTAAGAGQDQTAARHDSPQRLFITLPKKARRVSVCAVCVFISKPAGCQTLSLLVRRDRDRGLLLQFLIRVNTVVQASQAFKNNPLKYR